MAKKLTSAKAREILHDKSVHGHPLTEKQRKFFGAIAGGAKPYQDGGWLDKYEQGGLVLKQKTKDNYDMKPNANVSQVSFPPGFVGMGNNLKGRNYSPAWGGQFQDGGNLMPPMAGSPQALPLMQMGGNVLPGAAGFMYARTINPAPSNGPYAKKTKASAQNGKKVSYSQWKKQYNLKETPDYNLKRAWELGYTPDKTGHLPTVDNQTGQFLKAKGHPTLQLELDWYNSPEAADFRSKNAIDSSGKFFRYVPKGQNGQEMKYYQEGLDFTPKTISQDGVAIDPMGYWNPDNVGNPVIIPSTDITMQGVNQPLIGISDTGDVQYMQPGEDYSFDGEYVTEYPVAQKGKKIQAIDVKDMKAKRAYPQYPVDDPRSVGLFFNRYKKPEDKRDTLYVSDPKDPRLKTYQDSLALYNFYEKSYRQRKKENNVEKESRFKNFIGLNQTNQPDNMAQYYSNKKSTLFKKNEIHPIIEYSYKEDSPEMFIDDVYYPARKNVEKFGFRFKKPVQPVEYKKPDPSTLYVEDPKDPKLKRYQDSLQTYKNSKFGDFRGGDWTDPKGYIWTSKYPAADNYKPRPKKPIQKVEYRKPETKQEVIKKPEPVVEKKAPLTDYFQGTSVFAPTPYHGSGAGAFVGYRTPQGDTVFVKPEDYERMGVPKYGREFIESKKKMKNGGVSVNEADAQPLKKLDQLFNFTNYNKPTKDGWLDKYK